MVAREARAAEPVVRVLLESTPGPIGIELPDGTTRRLSAVSGRRLQVDVRPRPPGSDIARSVSSHWESARAGIHQIGELSIHGRVRVLRRGAGLAVIALVPLERYVEGGVGREMPSGWDPEALRAQAVVSRTYALHALGHPADSDYDVEATTTSQVFGGRAAAVATVRAAVAATRGQYLVHRGEPILAVFHSASGGQTAAAEEVWGDPVPYLRSIEVEEEEEAPSTYWRAAVSRTTLRRALGQLGLDVGGNPQLSVLERWPSGRVKRLELRGHGGARRLSGELLRRALGPDVVKSTLFELRDEGSEVVIVGSGHGHGVGMSQWGAKAMADGGASHQEILATFFPGTTLARVAPERAPAASLAAGGGE
jgi:stage II sporulation protein D